MKFYARVLLFLIFTVPIRINYGTESTNAKNLPLVLYVPGARGHCNSKNVYAHNNLLMYSQDQIYSFNFCDMINRVYYRNKCDLAQREDIAKLSHEYTKLCKSYKETYNTKPSIVLFGLCRGASTILKFAGTQKPDGIAAIVAESPYARVDDAIRYWYKFLPLSFKQFILKWRYPRVDFTQENTIDCVKSIDPNIPIALICVKTDSFLPYQSTVELYHTLINSGHTKVHLLILSKGRHARVTNNPKYHSFINAFYKKYGLPHDSLLAEKGAKYFLILAKEHT